MKALASDADYDQFVSSGYNVDDRYVDDFMSVLCVKTTSKQMIFCSFCKRVKTEVIVSVENFLTVLFVLPVSEIYVTIYF